MTLADQRKTERANRRQPAQADHPPTRRPARTQGRPRSPAAAARRLGRAVASWAWAAAALRLLSWAVAFVALAHVGGGTVQRLLAATPPEAWSTAGQPGEPPATIAPRGLASPGRQACGAAGCPVRDAGADAPEDRPPQAITADGRVVLNLADRQDLMRLDGVGVKRAAAIIELRSQLGRFRRVEDLLRVRGIGYRLLKRLRPQVVVDPPAEQP